MNRDEERPFWVSGRVFARAKPVGDFGLGGFIVPVLGPKGFRFTREGVGSGSMVSAFGPSGLGFRGFQRFGGARVASGGVGLGRRVHGLGGLGGSGFQEVGSMFLCAFS
jgi:hypothetical protein